VYGHLFDREQHAERARSAMEAVLDLGVVAGFRSQKSLREFPDDLNCDTKIGS
jgi:hypothetical protein